MNVKSKDWRQSRETELHKVQKNCLHRPRRAQQISNASSSLVRHSPSGLHSITALGVVLNDMLTATDHVSSLVTSCLSSMYAMRVCDQGLPASSLQDVFRATVIAKLIYGASAWSGVCSANDRTRLDARRTKRYGYCSEDIATINDLFSAAAADESLFKRVLHNELHLLQPLLPAKTSFSYNLRPRYHNRQSENLLTSYY